MSRSRTFTVALGCLALVGAATATQPAVAGSKADSPEARLRARTADLHAEVAVLEVECSASRQNLLENLKTLGKLELEDKCGLLSEIKEEVRQALTAHPLLDPNLLLARFLRNAEEDKLIHTYLKEKSKESEKALDQFAALELKFRLDTTRAESDRMKADYRKKCRLLYQKKLELADAEAEYKATR